MLTVCLCIFYRSNVFTVYPMGRRQKLFSVFFLLSAGVVGLKLLRIWTTHFVLTCTWMSRHVVHRLLGVIISLTLLKCWGPGRGRDQVLVQVPTLQHISSSRSGQVTITHFVIRYSNIPRRWFTFEVWSWFLVTYDVTAKSCIRPHSS